MTKKHAVHKKIQKGQQIKGSRTSHAPIAPPKHRPDALPQSPHLVTSRTGLGGFHLRPQHGFIFLAMIFLIGVFIDGSSIKELDLRQEAAVKDATDQSAKALENQRPDVALAIVGLQSVNNVAYQVELGRYENKMLDSGMLMTIFLISAVFFKAFYKEEHHYHEKHH